MTGWLSAYRVLDLTDEQGLLAGQMLAKLGADVIQAEPPQGSTARRMAPLAADGGSYFWSAYAAGKRGVTLDLAHPEGRRLAEGLVRKADFLLESHRPGALAALGLTRQRLMELNPALIHVSITPFGSDGPKAQYAASDLTVWAAGGPLHPNRDTEGPPLRISVPQAFLHAAADAVTGALIAHFARLKSGRGQHVDISAQQSATQATLGSHLAAAVGHEHFSLGGIGPPRMGKRVLDMSGSGARTRKSKWVVKDGLVEMHLAMGPAAGARTNNLMAWMRAEGALPEVYHDWDWSTVPKRILAGETSDDDIDAVRAAVARFLAPFTKAELQQAALKHKLLLAPINDMSDLLASPQLAARGLFATVREGAAERTLPWAFAVGPDGMFAEPRGAPSLGQHNGEVYGELLGLTAADLDGLAARGAI